MSLAFSEDDRIGSVILGAHAFLVTCYAVIGVMILFSTFVLDNDQADNEEDIELEEPEEKLFNDRVPDFLKANPLLKKIFESGWKFNLFNSTGQVKKQIAAISVIFALLQFSIVGVVLGKYPAYSLLVLLYTLCCLFSFLNILYVRDFEAIQVNGSPMVLAFMGLMITLAYGTSYVPTGMTLALLADSYFALRFKDDSDHIEFTLVEKFALESWSQNVFNQSNQLAL